MALDVFVKCLAKVPGTVSGDAFWYAEEGPRVWCLVVDGLGHGEEAAEAARLAVARISGEVKKADLDLEHMVRAADADLRGTRGAALSLALVDGEQGVGLSVGVGNVELRCVGMKGARHPVCTPGIVGNGLRRLRVERFDYRLGDLVLMHSDGMSSRFDLDRSDLARPMADLGEALLAQHARNDDVTLLMVKQLA